MDPSSAPRFRVGLGFDVHPFSDEPGRVLTLGGVAFPDGPALDGHSDADVIAHACTDAILGASGLGDIGSLFPDTDELWAGADSVDLLAEAARRARTNGWAVGNIDCTVVLDRPRIADHRATMEKNLAAVVGAPVTVKGKRTEGVSGLGGGIRCHAVALLVGQGTGS